MDDASQLRCMTCGQRPAKWLVAYGYSGPGGPGRILHYCDSDMQERIEHFSFVLPLQTVLDDSDRWLTLIYQAGLSESAPEMVAEHMGLDPRSPWITIAQRVIDENS